MILRKNLKILAISAIAAMTAFACVPANAGLNIFTEHKIVHMTEHGVNKYQDVPFPTGDYPYIGQIGLEYEFKKLSYSVSYIHRSNVDIRGGNEYYYNGIALGVKLPHCILACR